MSDAGRSEPEPETSFFALILRLFNLAAAGVGHVLLVWAAVETGGGTTSWHSVAIAILSLVSLAIMLLLLLPATFIVLTPPRKELSRARKELSPEFRLFLILSLAAGVITTLVAAAFCAETVGIVLMFVVLTLAGAW